MIKSNTLLHFIGHLSQPVLTAHRNLGGVRADSPLAQHGLMQFLLFLLHHESERQLGPVAQVHNWFVYTLRNQVVPLSLALPPVGPSVGVGAAGALREACGCAHFAKVIGGAVHAAVVTLHHVFFELVLPAREAVQLPFTQEHFFVGLLEFDEGHVHLVNCILECFEVRGDADKVAVQRTDLEFMVFKITCYLGLVCLGAETKFETVNITFFS